MEKIEKNIIDNFPLIACCSFDNNNIIGNLIM